MSKKAASTLIGVLGLLSLVSATGCSTVAGPNFGILNFPIPVSPYFQKAGGRQVLEPQALRADAGPRADHAGQPGDGAGSAVGRRSDAGVGEGEAGPGRSALPL